MNKRLGFIGLGNMGFGMVSNLLKLDYGVLVNDIVDEKVNAVVIKGAQKAGNLEEIANSVETVILCLPHPDISKKIITDLSDKNSKIKTIIDTSTLTPEDTREITITLAKKKHTFSLCPNAGGQKCSGSKTNTLSC